MSNFSEYCVISNVAGATKLAITEAKLDVSIVALSQVKIFLRTYLNEICGPEPKQYNLQIR